MNNTTSSPSQTADEPGVVFVVLACLLLSFWLLFLGFYFSRFAGLILTWFFNKFLIPKDAYLRIGKFLLRLSDAGSQTKYKTRPNSAKSD